MRFAIVTEGMPGPATAGGAMANWALLNSLVKQGHSVSAIVIVPPPSHEPSDLFESSLKAIHALGVSLHLLHVTPLPKPTSALEKWRQFLFPRYHDFYAAPRLKKEIVALLDQEKPDAVYVFDYGPLLALMDYRGAPRLASPGDPMFLVWKNRMRILHRGFNKSYVWNAIASRRANARLPAELVRVLAKYDAVAWYAAQHSRWLNERGVRCAHIHVPVAGYAGGDSAARRAARPTSGKPKIVMLGHLNGTANLVGLYPFIRETVPLLEKKLGREGFELAIVGRDKPNPDLAPDLDRPSVKLKGFVRDLDDEFFSADVMVAPANYEVGIRTRILMALSFGLCIVTDRTSALGIPELESGRNCLLATSSADLAVCLVLALSDRELNARLGRAARETFETYFTPEKAGLEISRHLEALAARNAAPNLASGRGN